MPLHAPSSAAPSGSAIPFDPSKVCVTGAFARLLLDWLDHERLAAPQLRAELARLQPDEALPVLQWGRMLEEAIQLKPGMGRGLEIGALIRPEHCGLLGYLALASDNLEQALLAYQRFEKLFYGYDFAELVTTPEAIEIRWSGAIPRPCHAFDDVAIAALVSFLGRFWSEPPAPLMVSFTCPPPADPGVYERFFHCPVRFGDSHVRVRFAASHRLLPMPYADPGLRALLDRQAQALLAALPQADSFEQGLQQALLKLLPEGAPTLAAVARERGLSVRTLQRRLAAHQLNFQVLLDRTRAQLARRYLADPSLSVVDVTLLLGYSGQSTFTRAFKAWTGQTPAAFRRAMQTRR